MRILKKLWNGITNIFYFVLILLIVAFLGCFALGIRPYITMSGSMETTIHTGSVCFVDTNAKYDEVEVGDIIAFKTSTGALVTHRAIAITDEGIETKGDNNDVSDGISTTSENFGGETLFSIPYIGYAVIHLQQPYGIAIICVLGAMIIALSVVDSISEKKECKEKELVEKKEKELLEEVLVGVEEESDNN